MCESSTPNTTKDREAATAIAANTRSQRELDEVRMQVDKHAAAVAASKTRGTKLMDRMKEIRSVVGGG